VDDVTIGGVGHDTNPQHTIWHCAFCGWSGLLAPGEVHSCLRSEHYKALVAQRDRFREALVEAQFALMDVARTRRSDAWGMAVTRANEALATVRDALDPQRSA
jgi:hypothetical protein